MGWWSRGALDHGHYCRAIHSCETYTSVVWAEQLKPLWFGGQWLKYKYGDTWQMDSHKPTKASTVCLWWWKQPLDNWKPIPCPMPPPGTLSWALESKSYGNMAPQKELSQTRGLISKTTSQTPGLKSMALCGFVTCPIMCQSPGKLNDGTDCYWEQQVVGPLNNGIHM